VRGDFQRRSSRWYGFFFCGMAIMVAVLEYFLGHMENGAPPVCRLAILLRNTEVLTIAECSIYFGDFITPVT
jgi:hypothetical protein